MAATFFIFLREGIEASMIVTILLAYLDRAGQRRHFRDIYLGVAAAAILVLAGGTAAYLTLETYAGSRVQTIFETVTYLLAAVVLTYMTLWMRRHARDLSGDLKARADAALDGRARWGLGLLAFQAVGREGLETMVFTLAILFASNAHRVALGAAGGLVAALAFAVAIYRFGKRLNVGLFFTVVGTLLMIFAAGLLADAVENLQQLGWLNIGLTTLWDTSGHLSEDSTLGDILHSFVGYADRPTVAQAVVYVAYLAGAITAFVRTGPRRRPSPARQPEAVTPAR